MIETPFKRKYLGTQEKKRRASLLELYEQTAIQELKLVKALRKTREIMHKIDSELAKRFGEI